MKNIVRIIEKYQKQAKKGGYDSIVETYVTHAVIEGAEAAYYATIKGKEAKFFISESSLERIKKKYEI